MGDGVTFVFHRAGSGLSEDCVSGFCVGCQAGVEGGAGAGFREEALFVEVGFLSREGGVAVLGDWFSIDCGGGGRGIGLGGIGYGVLAFG